ncbi:MULTISPECIES: histidine phosphatase family protein [unclassified Parafrankia]|uniref:SixA phosphatase family protein n=1 Tax=unclassified Parafrankia TaxID=2994368 RepID=UPI000DA43350|nr:MULTISPECIES: histidine phosphatase family protein [unclassified Parafrankia]TCJ36286.1 histidine phosphatase family protein [Parafrankia sp. BMG5.11]SQD96197.1 putative phosphohistidine phosphatase, SixA [Parafrankia sp. Ea1.12]
MRPTSRLLLLRHAKSDWTSDPEVRDQDRPLSPKGRRGIALVADYLAASGLEPDLVLCSSAVRTRETVEHLADALPGDVPVLVEDRLYLAEANDLLARLREIDDGVPTVLLVGHNPGIHTLAVGLLAPSERHRVPTFPTAALAVHGPSVPRWAELGPATTRLLDFVTPRSLRMSAGTPGDPADD